MWTKQTKTGKYLYTDRYTDAMTGKSRQVSVTLDRKPTAAARKEAAELIARKIEQKQQKTDIDMITVSVLMSMYKADIRQTLKASTYSRNCYAADALTRILGADTLLIALNAGYINKCLLDTGRAAGTLNEYLTRFKTIMRWAYRRDLINDISYIDKLTRYNDTPHRAKIQDKFLEAEEAAALLENMHVQKWRDLTAFLILSGLRFGEAAALLISDVDLKARVINVSKTYDIVNDLITTPKTRTSAREVYMQDELYALCRRLKVEALADMKIRKLSGEQYIFSSITDDRSKPVEYYAYNKYLKENAARVLGRSITPHTLRHTHASLLMENGMTVDMISHRLGHENSKITRDIYLHVTEKLKEKENAALKEVRIL